MNVTLCSAFRSATSYIERYCSQVGALATALLNRGDHLNCIWGEGDHTDDTPLVLRTAAPFYDAEIVTVNHGGPDHGSVVNAERFANMAKVWNEIWARIPGDADAVIFVEADLVWESCTMLALLGDLQDVPCVAPKIILRREEWPANFWYDNWGYWRNGVQIGTMPPYFVDLMPDTHLLELDSAGSCLVMRGDVARGLTWPPEDVIVGICRQIRERGGSVWLDAQQKVIHE